MELDTSNFFFIVSLEKDLEDWHISIDQKDKN